jgi:hypothetical protein
LEKEEIGCSLLSVSYYVAALWLSRWYTFLEDRRSTDWGRYWLMVKCSPGYSADYDSIVGRLISVEQE